MKKILPFILLTFLLGCCKDDSAIPENKLISLKNTKWRVLTRDSGKGDKAILPNPEENRTYFYFFEDKLEVLQVTQWGGSQSDYFVYSEQKDLFIMSDSEYKSKCIIEELTDEKLTFNNKESINLTTKEVETSTVNRYKLVRVEE